MANRDQISPSFKQQPNSSHEAEAPKTCESLQTPAGLFYTYDLIRNEAVGFVPESEAKLATCYQKGPAARCRCDLAVV